MGSKILNSYAPPEHFEEVKKLPSVVQEASDDNTELWLIRLPANEVGQADLLDKTLKLKVDLPDGRLGHFLANQGQEYNIVKLGKVKTVQPYAIFPNGSDPHVVKKIHCQVGFVKSLVAADRHRKLEKSSQVSKDRSTRHASDSITETEEIEERDAETPPKKKHRRPGPS